MRGKIKRMIDLNRRILEIGPLTSPFVKKHEAKNVYYADRRCTEDVKKLYESDPNVDCRQVVSIDFVIKESFNDTLKDEEKFDYIVLVHVVEHIHDLILFFNDISKCLNKDGRIVLIIPDKRYCFDHFRRESSFCDAVDVFFNGKKRLERHVFDAYFNTLNENDPEVFWKNGCGHNNVLFRNFGDALRETKKFLDGEVDDFHFWTFTDVSFMKFVFDMTRSKMFYFSVEHFLRTERNTFEFGVILKNKTSIENEEKSYDEEIMHLCSLLDEATKDINIVEKVHVFRRLGGMVSLKKFGKLFNRVKILSKKT